MTAQERLAKLRLVQKLAARATRAHSQRQAEAERAAAQQVLDEIAISYHQDGFVMWPEPKYPWPAEQLNLTLDAGLR